MSPTLLAKSASLLLVFADSGKVFPGACILTSNVPLGTAVVIALCLAMLAIEHRIADSMRLRRGRTIWVVTWCVAFLFTLSLAAIGAKKYLSDVLLFRVVDRQSFAIWLAILSAKVLPLALLIADAMTRSKR